MPHESDASHFFYTQSWGVMDDPTPRSLLQWNLTEQYQEFGEIVQNTDTSVVNHVIFDRGVFCVSVKGEIAGFSWRQLNRKPNHNQKNHIFLDRNSPKVLFCPCLCRKSAFRSIKWLFSWLKPYDVRRCMPRTIALIDFTYVTDLSGQVLWRVRRWSWVSYVKSMPRCRGIDFL